MKQPSNPVLPWNPPPLGEMASKAGAAVQQGSGLQATQSEWSEMPSSSMSITDSGIQAAEAKAKRFSLRGDGARKPCKAADNRPIERHVLPHAGTSTLTP